MTPRRIVLLVGGLLAFVVAYAVYARLFGSLDGLPVLPPRMLNAADGSFRPPPRTTSPTIELLKLAFGENSPETEPAYYPTQLEFRNGESSLVVAAGRPPGNPGSNRVTLIPFSAAAFSKPRPVHLRQPGEVTEISTFHADKAVLEFDRVINSPTDMNTAKLVRLELISDRTQTLDDPRRGLVHIINNQRSGDPNRHLVLRTVGPVFYRDPKVPPGSPPLLGPDVWTDAPVEIVDRGNIPRRPDAPVVTAPADAKDVRDFRVVAAILDGQRPPPPTITAVGMRIYLEPEKPPPPGQRPSQKSTSDGLGGVRRIELLERVLMNLWVEGEQGLVGAGGKTGAIAESSPGMMALGGGFVPGAQTAREQSRALMQVETRGPFAYDTQKNVARFDVLPQADPNLPNDVQVTKVPPRAGVQTLLSQVLELEFNGSPTGAEAGKPATPAIPRPGQPVAAAPPPATGAKFKKLHAWTYTPGRFLTVSSDLDQLQAHGQDLVHEQAAGKTVLIGAPLLADSQRNVLTAGGPKQPAILILEPAPGTFPGERKNQATVRGPGKVELYDAATGGSSVSASWLTSMVQTKEKINDRELDLFTFTNGAKFEDVKADYWLKGNVLKLWIGPPEGAPPEPVAGAQPTRGKPQRLQGIGAVSGHSADIDIEHTDHLNTLFRDVPPPAAPVAVVMPEPVPGAMPVPKDRPSPKEPGAGPAMPKEPKQPRDPAAPLPPPVAPGDPAPPPKDAEKPKPPTKLKARTVDTWVTRYPLPPKPVVPGIPPADAAAQPPASTGGMKYQLEKARCEGMVTVHQDPADATKPRGLDILGSLLLIDGAPEGNIMTVFGWDNRPGEVHNEGTSLIGPKVLLDQVHNLAIVEGRGSLVMPTSSDFTGAELKQPEVVVVHWRDGMKFEGAKKKADFFGKVSAAQGESWVTCHTMQVIFDRPVYFTQSNRPGTPAKPAPAPGQPPKDGQPGEDKPKIELVYCYPAPADTADNAQEKLVSYNQVDRDPDTGKPLRRQQLVAQELTLRALARDEGRQETYRKLEAEGPGVVRTWQPGTRDQDANAPPAPKQPGNGKVNPAPTESEMKLTVVNFTGRMNGKDKGKPYQEATFLGPVQVIHVPTEDPDLIVERHKLPPRAVLLTASEKLVVWTHRKDNEPAEQHMEAYGNAFLQSEEYDGWGEVITHDGKVIVFDDGSSFGSGGLHAVPARIKSRFKGNDNSGQKIIFDRSTNHYQVIKSIGGTITSTPSAPPPKKDPVPKQDAPPKK